MPQKGKNYNPLNDTDLLANINDAFIQKFKTDKYCYIYDVNTNEFLKVDEAVWDIFPDPEEKTAFDYSVFIRKHGKDKLLKAMNEIHSAIVKDNLFSSNRPSICMALSEDELRKGIEHKNQQTVLNVTEDCNFRCKYCIYSGIYNNVRTHNKKYMTWEIAKAAINDFLINSSEVENPALSFYGGEPMLAWGLIERCVSYLKRNNKKCHFSLTTNGSLVNKSNISYFVENDFSLSISLNGPKKNHDAYRVYKNGRGSWDKILHNISLIRDFDEDYFQRKVAFICTLTPPFKVLDCFKYFNQNFPKNRSRFTSIDYKNVKYFEDKFSISSLIKDYSEQASHLFDIYKERFINEDQFDNSLWSLGGFFEVFPFTFYKKPSFMLDNKFIPLGQCLIGSKRLFVDTDGCYLPCERIRERLIIGSVDTGLDYKKIYEYFKFFSESHSLICKDCPYIRFCSKCIRHLKDGNGNVEASLLDICSRLKSNLKNQFRTYMEIVESHPSSLKKLDNLFEN